MAAFDPLHTPGNKPPAPAALDVELRLSHELLAAVAAANIHDDQAMLQAAAGLYHRLRSLVAAVDAERGEQS